jgi:hypothetical protein
VNRLGINQCSAVNHPDNFGGESSKVVKRLAIDTGCLGYELSKIPLSKLHKFIDSF